VYHSAGRKKILFSFGTRPEAIKLGVLHRLMRRQSSGFDVCCAVTGQHRELLDQALSVFSIEPDYDLRLMEPAQQLSTLAGRVISGMGEIIRTEKPDLVLVQGDTTTALGAALAAFYNRTPVAHVEAGLRTPQSHEPYPEQMNRLLISRLSSLHFAPTSGAADNLLAEGVAPESVYVTGNTVVDALRAILTERAASVGLPEPILAAAKERPIVLVTTHRRENHGEPLRNICEAIKSLVDRIDVHVVVCLHPNPSVANPVRESLSGLERVILLDPLSYVPFIKLLSLSSLALSDSGGIQEEAPSLGTPVLVLRDSTERPEAVDSGWARLVGAKKENIVSAAIEALTSPSTERSRRNPFGDGFASSRIASAIDSYLHRDQPEPVSANDLPASEFV
jgi:UDP-N-acetylglucosamine 2-epimerase (non-hydrolysing)